MISTSTRSWLDKKQRELCPSDAELKTVRDALDAVETHLENAGGAFSIAKRHPCGSFAKSTMLVGRKEADLVVVLANAPSEETLDTLRDSLAACPGVQKAAVHFKAVELEFSHGVNVDVLPVAEPGVTASGPDIPDKLRHALSGPKHVEWFKKNAHGRPTHLIVRLLKKLKSDNKAFGALSSFAIEVLAVDILGGFEGDLADHFEKVLSQLAGGYLEGKTLPDPADASNDLLSKITSDERQAIAKKARTWLEDLQNGSPSSIFAAASAAFPSSNIGGKTLA